MNLATLSFRDITANEVEMVCQIVKPSFAEHVSPHYFREGRNDFLKTIEPEVIKTRLERGNSIYIAQRGHQVEGVIEFQSDNQILHFYIEPKEIEQGIGRKLFEYALGMRRWITPEIQKITVNASPTAVSLFQALGFRAESEERFINDGRFLPMAYVLEPIKLVLPSTEYKESFIAGNEESRNSREEYVNISTDFEAYIEKLNNHRRGLDLPENWVPYSTFWLVEGNEYIGTGGLRHVLNDYLKVIGGHIGYGIRPSYRKKGYGRIILKLLLAEAAKLGIKEALVTCASENLPSKQIIEANGGVLVDEVIADLDGVARRTLRYRIATGLVADI